MYIKTTKKNIRVFFVWLIIIIAELFLTYQIGYSKSVLQILSWLVIINMIAQVLTTKYIGIPILSFYTMFLIFLYLFHFGQIVCTAFLPTDPSSITNMVVGYLTDAECARKTIQISIIVIDMFFLGGIISRNNNMDYEQISPSEAQFDSRTILKNFALFLFLISFPLRLYIDLRQLTAAYLLGYSGAGDIDVSGVISAFAEFWYISVDLLIISNENPKRRKVFAYICITYIILTMFTGNRGHQLVNLIGIALVMHYVSGKPVKMASVLKYTVLGVLMLFLLNILVRSRNYGISYLFTNFGSVLEDTLNNNLIVQTIYEMGATIRTPYLVVAGYGRLFNPFFGETFIRGLLTCIPDVFGLLRNNTQAAIFARVLNETYHYGGLGGSFVGEMYYSFHNLYWVFPLIFGAIYRSVSDRVIYFIKNAQYEKIPLYLPFAVYSLWWVRDSVCGVYRSVVWLLILYWIVRHFNVKRMSR